MKTNLAANSLIIVKRARYAILTVLAGVGALYVSMWLQLDTPRWAIWTALTVSPPVRGAILRTTVARIIGTAIGCVATVILVASFPQNRIGYIVGLSLWLGVCGFFSTRRSTMVAYAATLAGYTVAIVGAGVANQPQEVF